MVTGEAPDLQDHTNSVGVEVTAAVKENDIKVFRLFPELKQGTPKVIEKSRQVDIHLFHLKIRALR